MKTNNEIQFCVTCGHQKEHEPNFCSSSFHLPDKKVPSFEDFKNQVAVKHGYGSFKEVTQQFGSIVGKYMEEATTLFVEIERKRVWKEACEAQRIKCADNMPASFNNARWFDMIQTAPLAEYKP